MFERYIKKVHNRHHGFIDLLWPKVLLAEHKSVGYDLDKALEQAEDYIIELPEYERPQCVLACDFQNFLLIDLDAKTRHEFKLRELPEKTELFDFMRGIHRRDFTTQDPVSVQASEIMASVYDGLRNNGYPEQDAARLLTKLTFCFFADDAGIFDPRGIMQEYLEETREDGSDLGTRLNGLFEVLNTPEKKRLKNTPRDLAQFPYVNGSLFRDTQMIPQFDADARARLLKAAEFDWAAVSPAIFGSLFQSVMNKKERRAAGAHYTTEENIMKVIRPLFLDDLTKKLDTILSKKSENLAQIKAFQNMLANINILDPACGSGNFLIIAYRELRRLETKVILKLHDPTEQRLNIDGLSKMDVNQFYGMEINEFSSKIAEVSLWMMDHIMNKELGAKFGLSYARIPLGKFPPPIKNIDALETDWNSVLPRDNCTYVCGNPPFGGNKRIDEKKRNQIKAIAGIKNGGGNLDYVTCWFIKAGQYMAPHTRIGLVATNSISQGDQVGQFWPLVYKNGIDISFAHEPFKWGSEAKGKAQVHVIIVGLAKKEELRGKAKRMFYYEGTKVFESNPAYISPYMLGSAEPLPVVVRSPKPLNGLPKIVDGAVPLDGGNLTLTAKARGELLAAEPESEAFIRPFVDADGFIKGKKRWVLYLKDIEVADIKSRLPHIMERVNATRAYRASCDRKATRDLADSPTLFAWGVVPDNTFLLIPRVTSENRKYIPIGYMKPPEMTSNSSMVLENADLGVFGLLTSWMHMVWAGAVGGRLEQRYRYSASIIYNTFPVPDGPLDALRPFAQKILDVRKSHPTLTMGNLYDRETMPVDLMNAHKRLDRAVEKMYRKEPFLSDRDRLVFLLSKYGLLHQKNQTLDDSPKRRRKRKSKHI